MLGEGLVNKVTDLVFESVVPEFRWKAVSNPSAMKRDQNLSASLS